MNNRKGVLLSAEENSEGKQILTFKVPSRGLLGFRSELINDTRGTAMFSSSFLEYDHHCGNVKKTNKGAIISIGPGITTAYALRDCEEKGVLFVGIGVPTYMGHVIGEHTLETDMEMNAVRQKKLTNVRSVGSEE